jgi:hypothetical protein
VPVLRYNAAMLEFFNQYSAVIVVGVSLLLVAFATNGFRRRKKTLIVVAVTLAVLTLGYFQVRTGPSSVPVAVAVDDALTGNRPVLMEVYSDF